MMKKLFKVAGNAVIATIAFYLFLSAPTYALIDWLTNNDFRPFEPNPFTWKVIVIIFLIAFFIYYRKESK